MKNAWIVGGTSGIGAAIADRLELDGWHVVVSGRSAPADLSISSPGRHELRVDVTSAESVERSCQALADAGLPLHALINCAGESVSGSVASLTEDDWQAGVQTKLLGYVRTMRASIPVLRRTRGTILNVIGSAAHMSTPNYALGSLNAALVHVTRGAARDLAPHGVRVLALNPGPTDTRRMAQTRAQLVALTGASEEDVLASVTGSQFRQRLIAPEELAEVAAFLLSPAASALNGTAVLADDGASGGWV